MPPSTAPATKTLSTAPPSTGLTLALLTSIYLVNFMDRSVLGILAESIKQEFALSDRMLGLLGGFSFAFFYTLMGLPMARRVPRPWPSWTATGSCRTPLSSRTGSRHYGRGGRIDRR